MPAEGREVVAFFDDAEAARRAGRELVFAGFHDDDVHLEEQRSGFLGALLGEEKDPGTLIRVSGSGRSLEAAAILHRAGGRDPDERRSAGAASGSATVEPAAADSQAEGRSSGERGGAALDLVAEDLVPQIEPVQVGEVRIRKRVVSEKRTIEVEVRHEEVSVEHHPTAASGSPLVVMEYEKEQDAAPVPAPADAAPAPADAPPARLPDDEDVTRVPVLAEQIVVSRRPYVVEEIWVRKRRVVERRTITGEVRREELDVEPVGDVAVEENEAGAIVRSSPRAEQTATE